MDNDFNQKLICPLRNQVDNEKKIQNDKILIDLLG